MQSTRLGNTGLPVSRLAFGTMTFGSPENASSVCRLRLPAKTQEVQAAILENTKKSKRAGADSCYLPNCSSR